MSQSDYINRKKTAQILYEKEDLDHILPSQQLTNFKTVVLPNDIEFENVEFNPLLPANKQRIVGIDNGVSSIVDCPTFVLCNNTQMRLNRKSGQMSMFNHRNVHAKNENFWNLKKQNKLCFEKEFEKCK